MGCCESDNSIFPDLRIVDVGKVKDLNSIEGIFSARIIDVNSYGVIKVVIFIDGYGFVSRYALLGEVKIRFNKLKEARDHILEFLNIPTECDLEENCQVSEYLRYNPVIRNVYFNGYIDDYSRPYCNFYNGGTTLSDFLVRNDVCYF